MGLFRRRTRGAFWGISPLALRQRGFAMGLNGFDWVRFVEMNPRRRSEGEDRDPIKHRRSLRAARLRESVPLRAKKPVLSERAAKISIFPVALGRHRKRNRAVTDYGTVYVPAADEIPKAFAVSAFI